jgi:superfamily I DNA and/or RNA helicase
VSITRAKALMIIVGNPRTLRNDCNWYDLMKFCQTNGGCVSPIRIGMRPTISSELTSALSDMTIEFNQLDVKTNNQKIAAKDFL